MNFFYGKTNHHEHNGGLELPKCYYYFFSNRLLYVSKCPRVDQAFCDKVKILNLPFISFNVQHHNCFKNLNINTFLTVLWETQITKSQFAQCKLMHIWNNPDICQEKNNYYIFHHGNKREWKNHENVIQDGNFISFQELISKIWNQQQ